MRINQIRSLFWVGNLVVLAGMGWVVFQFTGTLKTKGQIPDTEWPSSGAADGPVQRWPPVLPTFQKIWSTYINGEVPPPPEVVKVKPKKKDPKGDFLGKFTYIGGMEYLADPTRSTVRYSMSGQDDATMRVGEVVSLQSGPDKYHWQLTSFRKKVEEATEPDKAPLAFDVLVFRLRGEDVEAVVKGESPENSATRKLNNGELATRHVPKYTGPVQREKVAEDVIAQQAFLDSTTGDWWLPDDEIRWWEDFGEEALAKTSIIPRVDGAGAAHGLQFKTRLGGDLPALKNNDRGVRIGDVLLSLNGVAMNSKEELIRYLRGPGKGLLRYEAVFETNGKERTVLYRRSRRALQ